MAAALPYFTLHAARSPPHAGVLPRPRRADRVGGPGATPLLARDGALLDLDLAARSSMHAALIIPNGGRLARSLARCLARCLALAITLDLGFVAAALPASSSSSTTAADADLIVAQVALASRDPASWRRRPEEELLTYLSPNDLCYRRPSGLHSALRREFRWYNASM